MEALDDSWLKSYIVPIILECPKPLTSCASVFGGHGCVLLLLSTSPVVAFVHRLSIRLDLLMACYHLCQFPPDLFKAGLLTLSLAYPRFLGLMPFWFVWIVFPSW